MHGLASHFVWLNRGKESICVDLKAPEGFAAIRSLIAGVDVFVQNVAPGATERPSGSGSARRSSAAITRS